MFPRLLRLGKKILGKVLQRHNVTVKVRRHGQGAGSRLMWWLMAAAEACGSGGAPGGWGGHAVVMAAAEAWGSGGALRGAGRSRSPWRPLGPAVVVAPPGVGGGARGCRGAEERRRGRPRGPPALRGDWEAAEAGSGPPARGEDERQLGPSAVEAGVRGGSRRTPRPHTFEGIAPEIVPGWQVPRGPTDQEERGFPLPEWRFLCCLMCRLRVARLFQGTRSFDPDVWFSSTF